MTDYGDTPDMILRRTLEAARRRYALEGQQDPRSFDVEAAKELIFNMTGPAPEATVQWLRALADVIWFERRTGDHSAQRAAHTDAYIALRESLLKPTTTN